MKELFEQIIRKEWLMFSATQNIGGQASCQQDPAGFEIMRFSQFSAWDEESLRSYLDDLERAEKAGENLLAMKYAYMMESTDPAYFEKIKASLPTVEGEKKTLVDALTGKTLAWCREFASRYPHVAKAGRPIEKSSDSLFTTSVETYSRGEFSTYGVETLRSLLRRYESLEAEGVNLHERVVERDMQLMGVESLEKAEEILKNR